LTFVASIAPRQPLVNEKRAPDAAAAGGSEDFAKKSALQASAETHFALLTRLAQNGFSITRMTIAMISTVGTSLINL
jgi:hypothetical protein